MQRINLPDIERSIDDLFSIKVKKEVKLFKVNASIQEEDEDDDKRERKIQLRSIL